MNAVSITCASFTTKMNPQVRKYASFDQFYVVVLKDAYLAPQATASGHYFHV